VEEMGEPELNGEILNQIILMGLPDLAAKHALHITGNNNADMAVMWYFDNMDNPILTQPLVVKKKSGGGAGGSAPT
jgi:ubiquitin carboxyl-terminal hydrolase 5/13